MSISILERPRSSESAKPSVGGTLGDAALLVGERAVADIPADAGALGDGAEKPFTAEARGSRLATDAPSSSASASSSASGQGRGVVAEANRCERPAVEGSLSLRDAITMTKPRIVTMIVITTVATTMTAMAIVNVPASLTILDWMALLVGTALVAAAAGTANQWMERGLDAQMSRTANRPPASGRVSRLAAWIQTGFALAGGAGMIVGAAGWQPAFWAVATFVAYVAFYTPMKTRTSWNTTVGAIAGAMPVWIGYAAGGGTLADPVAWLLFGLMMAWQYPHFMAIAWLYRRQYAAAGFRMSTTEDPTGRSAGWQAIVGSLVVMACGVVWALGHHAWPVAIATAAIMMAAALPMLIRSKRFLAVANDVSARSLLRSSLLVLPIMLLIGTLGCWLST